MNLLIRSTAVLLVAVGLPACGPQPAVPPATPAAPAAKQVDLSESLVGKPIAELQRELDEERKQKKLRGPLHGIPVLIKDNIESADKLPTTAGAVIDKALQVLKDAGATLVEVKLPEA